MYLLFPLFNLQPLRELIGEQLISEFESTCLFQYETNGYLKSLVKYRLQQWQTHWIIYTELLESCLPLDFYISQAVYNDLFTLITGQFGACPQQVIIQANALIYSARTTWQNLIKWSKRILLNSISLSAAERFSIACPHRQGSKLCPPLQEKKTFCSGVFYHLATESFSVPQGFFFHFYGKPTYSF